ncbi:uncharacterized protein C15orf39 homolog [Leptodactylus fuscus]
MAGKRHFGTMDHMMHNKLSRLEMASQRATACFGIAATQELQTYQNFMNYSVPDNEGHGSSGPWSSTAAYLQYAGTALNDHLQTKEASVKYQRPQVDRPHNPLQLSDNSHNQASVHQSPPTHSYHMSCPRVCPPIAMPRPVYRSPTNYIDAAYGSRGYQSLDVCVSQPFCPTAVDWNPSARFAHSSSPLYASATKKSLSSPNTYPEVSGSPSSLSQGVQEQNPVYRHQADLSLAVGISSTYSQKDIFTDACHSVAQQNVQLLYADGNVPVGRHRSSAFTTPSPKHNKKPSAHQGSLDHQLGHLYSKNPYSNTINSIHQRSAPFSCRMDLTESPYSARGSSVYSNQAQQMHSGYVNAELRVHTSQPDGTLQPSERPFHVNPSTQKTVPQIPVCSPERDKNLWVQSSQRNRDQCGMSSRVDKEMCHSTPANRSLPGRTTIQDPFTGQSTHAAFVQKSAIRSSVIAPVVTSQEVCAGQHASRTSVTLESSSLHSSIHSFEDSRVTDAQAVENATKNHSRSHINLAHAESTGASPSSVSGIGSQCQISHHNVRSRHDVPALLSPNCKIPRGNVVDADEPKSIPTSVNEDMSIDNPKSPPMPVINDVFSLAPYSAYLEGKAPHPFALPQESEVQNIASTSRFVEVPQSEERREKGDDVCSNTKVVHAKNNDVEKKQNGIYMQNGEQEVSVQNIGEESVVLDLSLKKVAQTGSSSCGQQDKSCHDKDTLLTDTAEKCLNQAGKRIQVQEHYISSDNSRIFYLNREKITPQATSVIVEARQVNHPPSSSDKQRSSGQDIRITNEILLCQRKKNLSQSPKTFPWQPQNYPSQVTETQKNKLKESPVPLSPKTLSSRHQEDESSQDAVRLPSQHKKSSPSQMIERLSQKLRKHPPPENCKNKSQNFQYSYRSHSNKNLPFQPQDMYSSQVPESMSQQELSSSSNHTLKTLPIHNSIHNPSHSEFSVFMNSMQTQATLLPVILPSPPTLYFTNTIALHTAQPTSLERHELIVRNPLESCYSLSSPSGSENESSGFHSSKSFMFRKYKMKKFSSSEQETHRVNTESSSKNVSNPFLSDSVQSLPPSAPESSPVLGEANVSLASVGEPSPNSSGKQFSELHRSVQTAITSSVARSPPSFLEDWLSKTKEEETSKAPLKTKNSFRSNDQSLDVPSNDIWLAFDGVGLLLHKLLSQLETFMFTRRCPFPHVIRAGAIFIPIFLVKEVLFPELLGPAVDKILQKHKVELRPTTLSEEKLLRETELKPCSSRMLKLLALKQLPDVYPDLLCLFCRHAIQLELGKSKPSLGKEEIKLPDSSKKEPHSSSPRKVKSSLIVKLRRVRKHSGIHVYKTQDPKTKKKKSKKKDKLLKRPVCRRKSNRTHPVFSYKKRRRRRRNKSFPNLVGRRILHLFDDGEQEVWFPGKVLRVHRRSRNPRDTQFEVWYDEEPGTRYFLELLQDYEKGWLRLDG